MVLEIWDQLCVGEGHSVRQHGQVRIKKTIGFEKNRTTLKDSDIPTYEGHRQKPASTPLKRLRRPVVLEAQIQGAMLAYTERRGVSHGTGLRFIGTLSQSRDLRRDRPKVRTRRPVAEDWAASVTQPLIPVPPPV